MPRFALLCCAALLALIVVAPQHASATAVVLAPGDCAESERIQCPLTFGQSEWRCPDAADGGCPAQASSCCMLLTAGDDPSVELVDNDSEEFVVSDGDTNIWSEHGLTLDGSALAHTDVDGVRALQLVANMPLTIVAPADHPLCAFSITLRFSGAGTLRVMASAHEQILVNDGSISADFYDDYALDSTLLCGATELTLLVVEGSAPVEVQALALCLAGASEQCGGVCNGQCAPTNGDSVATNDTTPSAAPTPATYVPPVLADDATLAHAPVEPRLYCNRRGNDTCWSLFGYHNPNLYDVALPAGSAHNRFDTAPHTRGQTSLFGTGTTAIAFAVQWPCRRYYDRRFFWELSTPTLKTGNQTRRAWVDRAVHDCDDLDFAALLA